MSLECVWCLQTGNYLRRGLPPESWFTWMSPEAGFELEYFGQLSLWAFEVPPRVIAQDRNSAISSCPHNPPPLPTATHKILCLKSSKAKRIKWKARVWQAYIKEGLISGQMFLTLAAALPLGDLWLWPWIPLSVFVLTMHRGPSLKHEACCWLCSQAWCLPNLPSSVPIAASRDFSHHHDSRTHTPSLRSLETWLFQEKLRTDLLGMTAAVSDHREHIFPTGCFPFRPPGALVVFTFGPCHFIVLWMSIWVRHLASKYPSFFGSNWVQMFNSLAIDHWNGKIKNFTCLFFSALNPVMSHFCRPWGP